MLALTTIGTALARGTLDVSAATSIQNPVGIAAAGSVPATIADVANVGGLLAIALAVASLVVRFRRARGVERQQLKWFAFTGAIGALGVALASAGGFGAEPLAIAGWFTALLALVIGIPTAAGMAIFRHRLYDIDVVINRTVVYGALTASLAAIYVGSILVLQLALNGVTGDSGLAVAGSTLAVAAAFGPARARIQQAVDRRFFRRRYDASRTLEDFSARLRDQVDLAALDAELRGVIAETMQPAHVSVWLREPAAE
jgi:hypothetical protein